MKCDLQWKSHLQFHVQHFPFFRVTSSSKDLENRLQREKTGVIGFLCNFTLKCFRRITLQLLNLILIADGGPNTPLISFHFWTFWVFWTICLHAYLWESKIFNLVYNGKIQYGECANFWNWHLPTPRVATHVSTRLVEYCHIGSILPHSMKFGWILSYQINFFSSDLVKLGKMFHKSIVKFDEYCNI